MSENNLPADVIKFLKEHQPDPTLKDSDLTIDRAAAVWKCSASQARRRLNAMVKEGLAHKEFRQTETAAKTSIYIINVVL